MVKANSALALVAVLAAAGHANAREMLETSGSVLSAQVCPSAVISS